MRFVRTASLLMAAAVLLGAFGAHGLEAQLTAERMEIYQTAVFYHFFHGLGLFAAAWVYSVTQNRNVLTAGYLFITGILLFSGSLYALAVTGMRMLGMITPFGGISFIAGWTLMAFGGKK